MIIYQSDVFFSFKANDLKILISFDFTKSKKSLIVHMCKFGVLYHSSGNVL